MKLIDRIKYVLLSLGVILIYMVASNVAVDYAQKPLRPVKGPSFSTNMDVQNYKVYKDSLVLWDQSNIFFYSLEGDLLDQVFGNGYFTDVYFYGDDVLVLDRQFNTLYTYDPYGQLVEKLDLEGSVFGIFDTRDGYFLHYKDQENLAESIVSLESGDLAYETNRFIVDFYKNRSSMYVAEMTTENYAYRSSVLLEEFRRSERYNFDNETILGINKVGRAYILVTNKNLYRLEDGEKDRIAIEDFRNFFFDVDKVGILTAQGLSIYNSNLEELESYKLDIDPIGSFKVQGGYFVYGPTEMIGFIGQDREFRQEFDQIVYGASANDRTICLIHRQAAQIYRLEEIKIGE